MYTDLPVMTIIYCIQYIDNIYLFMLLLLLYAVLLFLLVNLHTLYISILTIYTPPPTD